jgi:hypothetical protein
MIEPIRRVIRRFVPGREKSGHDRDSRSGTRLDVRLVGAGLLIVLVAVGGNWLSRRNNSAINVRRRPSGVAASLVLLDSTASTLKSKAPSDDENPDAGVAEAARQTAMTLIAPELKHPDSAAFPREAIRVERLSVLNRMTGGSIEHWLVDGAVESRNDHGYNVHSAWRILLAREADWFFPVLASLAGVEVYYLRSHADMLAEARKDAIKKRNMAAREKKSRSLAEKRAVWKALDAVKGTEAKAQAALQLAVDLLAAGRTEPARRRLQDLIDSYPGTQAAEKAEELLEK